MSEFASQHKNLFADWLSKGQNFQFKKIVISFAITWYFIFLGYLTLPTLNGSLTSSIAIFLIFPYLLNNIIQLIRNPAQFRKANMLRLTILLSSVKKTFFVLIGTVVLIFIPSAILGFKFVDEVNLLLFALVGYNLLMAYNEYKILKMKAWS